MKNKALKKLKDILNAVFTNNNNYWNGKLKQLVAVGLREYDSPKEDRLSHLLQGSIGGHGCVIVCFDHSFGGRLGKYGC